jgi:hypothetical protein
MLLAYFHAIDMSTAICLEPLARQKCANGVRELLSIGKSNADTRVMI